MNPVLARDEKEVVDILERAKEAGRSFPLVLLDP
jgi:hypothetical protein